MKVHLTFVSGVVKIPLACVAQMSIPDEILGITAYLHVDR